MSEVTKESVDALKDRLSAEIAKEVGGLKAEIAGLKAEISNVSVRNAEEHQRKNTWFKAFALFALAVLGWTNFAAIPREVEARVKETVPGQIEKELREIKDSAQQSATEISRLWSGSAQVIASASRPSDVEGFGLVPPGTLVAWGCESGEPMVDEPEKNASVPRGWLLCRGQLVLKSKYAALFRVLGATWSSSSSGEGVFELPDFRGMFLRGANGNLRSDDFRDELQAGKRYRSDGTTDARSFGVGTWQRQSMSAATYKTKSVDVPRANPENSFDLTLLEHVEYTRPIGADHPNTAECRPKNAAVNWIIKY